MFFVNKLFKDLTLCGIIRKIESRIFEGQQKLRVQNP